MVTKADLASNTPTSNQLVLVANGETVYAETENTNNLLVLQAIILLFNWIADQAPQTGVATTYTALQTYNVNNGTNPDIGVGNITSSISNGNVKVIPNGTGKFFYGADAAANNEVANQAFVNNQIANASTVTGIQMTGATAGTDGTPGAVPAPAAGEQNKVFAGSGAWTDIATLNALPVNNQTGTTYTIQNSDLGKFITFSNAGPITVTVPSTLPTDFSCTGSQKGVGQVTFTGSGGITIRNSGSFTKTRGQYAVIGLLRDGSTNDIYLAGDAGG